jgi:hypothetical protein
VLCCAVLCCAVLCCAVLCCAVLCCAVQADYGLFTACEGSGALYPSPTAERLPQGLALLEFIGDWEGCVQVWCECVGVGGDTGAMASCVGGSALQSYNGCDCAMFSQTYRCMRSTPCEQ